MRHVIYIIECEASRRSYIGLTSQPLIRRWTGHKSDATRKRTRSLLHKAIRRYGANAFSIRVIAEAGNRDEAKRLESAFIEERGTRTPHGYNLTSGGDCGPNPKGFRHTSATKAKMSSAAKGKKKSAEHRASLSRAHKGKSQPHKAELARQIGLNNRGRVFSEEIRAAARARRRAEAMRRDASKTASGFVGVYQRGDKWRARIKRDGKRTWLGSFASREAAKAAYDTAAAEHLVTLA